jgi:hypothetical protein
MDGALRGLVISKWEESGRPRWNFDRTVRETESADEELARQGGEPAPAFRRHRMRRDEANVRKWVRGCKFPWVT